MSMQKKGAHYYAGVSLLELVFYLAIFSLLISTSFYWVTSTCIPCVLDSKKINIMIETETAIDLFLRDIKGAPAQRKKWKCITGSELIWQTNEGEIGWALKNGRMVRV